MNGKMKRVEDERQYWCDRTTDRRPPGDPYVINIVSCKMEKILELLLFYNGSFYANFVYQHFFGRFFRAQPKRTLMERTLINKR